MENSWSIQRNKLKKLSGKFRAEELPNMKNLIIRINGALKKNQYQQEGVNFEERGDHFLFMKK